MRLSVFFPRYETCLPAAGAVLCGLAALALPGLAAAAEPVPHIIAAHQTAGPSGLPLPRFVTLKANRVNMRIGPDQNKYPVIWSYRQQGLPVEIVQEYDNWRRIRDSSGTTGWVNAALLSGKRAVIIAPQQKDGLLPLYAAAGTANAVTIRAEPGVIGAIRRCDGEWCELEIAKYRGYIQEDKLWGVYRREVIE